MREEALIAALLERVPHSESPEGPGDDAARLPAPPAGNRRVLSTDALVEDVHFLRAHPPAWLAQKVLAANLADVSAMGAVPEGITLSVALPRETPEAWWLRFAEGLGEGCRRADIVVAGGDLCSSPGPIFLSVTAWGLLPGEEALTRSGGVPGDLLMTLGMPGLSQAGWMRWRALSGSGWGEGPLGEEDRALLAHLRPRPDLEAGPWALAHGAHAAMDLSDGLARDAERLAQASGLCIDLQLEALPPLPRGITLSDVERVSGGEDHELLVLVPPQEVQAFEGRGFFTLGVAREPQGVPGLTFLRHGEPVVLELQTYEHF